MIRRTLLVAATVLGLVALGAATAPVAAPGPRPQPTVGDAPVTAAIDHNSRSSVRAAYQNVLKPALAVPIGWTGSVNGCVAGAPSAAAQTATLTAVNYFRDFVGLPGVTFDATYSAKAQEAALMMQAQGALSHTPTQPWACYTPNGAQAAGNSNLYLGRSGASAIAGYMVDPGAGNYFAGHRRWIMYPPALTMGSGSTSSANALWVFGATTTPPSTPTWMPWPAAGYFPVQTEPGGRWSLTSMATNVDFSSATVSMTSLGQNVPVTVQPVLDGYGNPTLVWQLTTGYATGQADRAYNVTVSNILVNGTPTSYQYTVTLFDAEIDPAQTLTFTQPPNRTYGDAPFTVSATASSGLPVSFTSSTQAVCTTSGTNGATVAIVGTGTCTITANQPGNATFNPAPAVARSFTVAKKALTVTANSTARAPKVANPSFTVSYGGFVLGQTFATSGITGAPSCATTATVNSVPGTYPITCTAGTLASTRYTFTFAPGTLTVLDYMPTAPARLLETRPGLTTVDGQFQGQGIVPADHTVLLTVAGRAGIAADATAVVINVTVTGPTAAGFLTIHPCGSVAPNASSVNFGPNQTVANLAVAKIGTNGQVCITTTATTHIIVDTNGWYPNGTTYSPVSPARLLETRPGLTTIDGQFQGGGAIPAGTFLAVTVAGRAGIPAGATAVVLNVTVTSPMAAGFITVYPCGATIPNASTLNYGPNQTIPNLAVAKIGTNGQVCIFTTATTHLVIDATGWYPAATTFAPLNPTRLLETRPGLTTVDHQFEGGGAIPAGTSLPVTIAGRATIPATATAAVLNITVTGATAPGLLTIYPCGTAVPNASNLNYAAGQTVANLAVAKIGTGGQVCVATTATAHVIIDATGSY